MPADVPRGLTAVGPFVVKLLLSLWTLLTPSRQKAANSLSREVLSDVAGGLRSYFQRGFLVRRGSERGARRRRQTWKRMTPTSTVRQAIASGFRQGHR